MSIRAKVVLLVLPLIIAPLLLTGFVASLSARNGITAIATSLLKFKMDDLLNYANSQWSLLVENNMVDRQDFVDAARAAVATYARSLTRSDSELIFALDANGKVAMSTGPVMLGAQESRMLFQLQASGASGWQGIRPGGRPASRKPLPSCSSAGTCSSRRKATRSTERQRRSSYGRGSSSRCRS